MGIVGYPDRLQEAQSDGEVHHEDHPDEHRAQEQDVSTGFAQREQKGQEQQDDRESAGIYRIYEAGDDNGGQQLAQVHRSYRWRAGGGHRLLQRVVKSGINGEGLHLTLPGPQAVLGRFAVHLRLPDYQTRRQVGRSKGGADQVCRNMAEDDQRALGRGYECIKRVGHRTWKSDGVGDVQQQRPSAWRRVIMDLRVGRQAARLQ